MFKNSRLKEMTNWDDVVPALDNKRAVVLPWWEEEACEDDIVADRKYFVCPALIWTLKYNTCRSEPQDERARAQSRFAFRLTSHDACRLSRARPNVLLVTRHWTLFGRYADPVYEAAGASLCTHTTGGFPCAFDADGDQTQSLDCGLMFGPSHRGSGYHLEAALSRYALSVSFVRRTCSHIDPKACWLDLTGVP